jgi:hypothetical protein
MKGGLKPSSTGYFRSNLVERKNFIGQAGACDKAGHTPGDARGLVLDDDWRVLVSQGFASLQAVVSHPSSKTGGSTDFGLSFCSGQDQTRNRTDPSLLIKAWQFERL